MSSISSNRGIGFAEAQKWCRRGRSNALCNLTNSFVLGQLEKGLVSRLNEIEVLRKTGKPWSLAEEMRLRAELAGMRSAL